MANLSKWDLFLGWVQYYLRMVSPRYWKFCLDTTANRREFFCQLRGHPAVFCNKEMTIALCAKCGKDLKNIMEADNADT